MDDDLEAFRKTWKKELSCKSEENDKVSKKQSSPKRGGSENEIGHAVLSQSVSAGPSASSSEGPAAVAKDEEYVGQRRFIHNFLDDQNMDYVRKRKNTMKPFVMAECLLKGGTTDAAGDLWKSPNRVENESRNGQKRKQQATDIEPEFKKQRLLDLFIADLDEINEIPFFDVELPRELALKIFKFLGPKELCRCAQVSKAWKSLAEDEYLWCCICHKLGYQKDSQTVEQSEWKKIVESHVRHNQQLQMNWRNRIGDLSQLQYVRGGVLSAVHSCGDLIVAGYTNGDAKLWNLAEDDECTLKPSSTSLVLDEAAGEGTIANYLTHIRVNPTITVAAYSQGNVDIWNNEEGRDPYHTFRCPGEVGQLCIHGNKPKVAASQKNILRVAAAMETPNTEDSLSFESSCIIDFEHSIEHLQWVPQADCHSADVLAVAGTDWVKLYQTGSCVSQATTLHHITDMSITALDVTSSELACGTHAVGFRFIDGGSDEVKLYSLETSKQLVNFKGHTWQVRCINMRDSPPGTLVTGCADKRVRVYDYRLSDPVVTLQGHSAPLTAVQMDEWKVVSGSTRGEVCVWDKRMTCKLWETQSRHPVGYLHFTEEKLIVANISNIKFPQVSGYDDESIVPLRYRGTLDVYNFLADHSTKGIPSICLSTYDEPEAYNYNINLAMPYDKI